MANKLTKSLREGMIEMNNLEIPCFSDGFIDWLTESGIKSKTEANSIVEKIRQADIETWEPGDPEFFHIIREWINEASIAKFNSVRYILHEFVFTLLESRIKDFKSRMDKVEKESKHFLAGIVEAYEYYLLYMRISLE